jgi:hypothetical protein
MDSDTLKEAVRLARTIGHVFVATADRAGMPHMAAARKIALASDEKRLTVEEWFCPGILANLQENSSIAIVVWDHTGDFGYQLLGETTEIEDMAVMNGYVPATKDEIALPQVERRLLVRVDKVIDFSCAPHTDVEE